MDPACSSMGTEPLKCRRHPAGLSPVQTHGPFLFGCFKAAPVPLSTSLRNVQSERQRGQKEKVMKLENTRGKTDERSKQQKQRNTGKRRGCGVSHIQLHSK